MESDETLLERAKVYAYILSLWVVFGPPLFVVGWQVKTYLYEAEWFPVSLLTAMHYTGLPLPKSLPGLLEILNFFPFAVTWLLATLLLWGWIFERN